MKFVRKGLPDSFIKLQLYTMFDLEPTLSSCLPPTPRFTVRCPVCGSTTVCIKHYLLHSREKLGKRQYRVDVWFKCMNCFAVWVHGIHLPEELYYEIKKRCGEYRDYGDYGHYRQD